MRALLTTHQKQRVLTGILERAVASLELTPAQRKSIEETYRECGEYLGESLGYSAHLADIFAQGSMRLGTVIRPFRDITDVFDLDVVFLIALLSTSGDPETLRSAVGKRLQAKYNGALKPLAKGWRLDFSAERDYYLDIIPAMNSPRGGNVIAITDGAGWRDSNPRDYAIGFELAAAELPRYEGEVMLEKFSALANSARIEPLPEYTPFKSPLLRIVQISKRYRDYYFNKKIRQPALLPASIIITTLLMKAYARKVHARVYESGFDLLLSCVEDMPAHLDMKESGKGHNVYVLPNPSLPSENLVEKWSDPKYAEAFFRWHRDYMNFLHALLQPEGAPRQLLSEALGAKAINVAFAHHADNLSAARRSGVLSVESGIGLTLGTKGTVSSVHTIHGAP